MPRASRAKVKGHCNAGADKGEFKPKVLCKSFFKKSYIINVLERKLPLFIPMLAELGCHVALFNAQWFKSVGLRNLKNYRYIF